MPIRHMLQGLGQVKVNAFSQRDAAGMVMPSFGDDDMELSETDY